MWRKCPFSRHYPKKDDCDFRIRRRRAVVATQPEMLLMPLSASSHKDAFPSNHWYKEDNLTRALKSPYVSQSKSVLAAPQHAIHFRALERRLKAIQSKKCLLRSSLLHFIDLQWKEMASLEEYIHLLKYDHAELHNTGITTIFPKTYPSWGSVLPFSTCPWSIHTIAFPSAPIAELEEFNIAKFIWEKNAMAAPKEYDCTLRQKVEVSTIFLYEQPPQGVGYNSLINLST